MISLSLSCCLVSSPVAHADVLDYMLGGVIGWIQTIVNNTTGAQAAKVSLRACFMTTPTSSTSKVRVSGDDMTAAVWSLTSVGIPVNVVWNSAVNGYVLKCIAEPRDPSTGALIDSAVSYTGRYYVNGSANPVVIYYSDTLDSTTTLANMNARVGTINASVTNIYNYLTGTFSGYVDGIESSLTSLISSVSVANGYISNTQYVSPQKDSNGDYFPTYTISKSMADQICANLNSNHVGRKIHWLSQDRQSTVDYTFVFACIESGYIRVYFENLAGGTFYNSSYCTKDGTLIKYVNDSSGAGGYDDSELLAILENIETMTDEEVQSLGDIADDISYIKSLLTVNYKGCRYYSNSSGSAFAIREMHYDIATAFLAYVMAHHMGHEFSVIDRDTKQVTTTGTIANVALVSSSGLYRVAFLDSSGYYYYLVDGANRIVTVPKSTNYGLSIVEAVDSIYNWLDNADLATNTTIQELITGLDNEVNDTVSSFNNIKGLFKAAFGSIDDGYGVSNWSDGVLFFNDLWKVSDPK